MYVRVFLITFAKLKIITKMKKIIVLACLFFCGLFLLSACDTQKKCAAYGHYQCYPSSAVVEE